MSKNTCSTAHNEHEQHRMTPVETITHSFMSKTTCNTAHNEHEQHIVCSSRGRYVVMQIA
jgi:hypothetical protein